MPQRWTVKAHDAELIRSIQQTCSVSPVVAQILAVRGITHPDQVKRFLDLKMTGLRPPDQLPGVPQAVEVIYQAIVDKQKIYVYGDYDADGMTSTAILFRCIQLLGGQVSYFVPNRLDDGYGVNSTTLEKLRERGAELVVTVDGSLGELALQVPLSRGEAVDSNNAIRFRLGDRDNKLNVLYMEGTAGSEYRWIRDGLQEDPQIRCVSMVLNNQYAQRPSLQRVDDRYRGFPATRSELFKYDVVICSDIPRGAFTPEQIAWTVDLVSKRGGGFAMVGGHTSFGSGGWDRTPWEQLIPFDMTGRRDYLTQSFRVDVPSAAESHPIWKLLDDPVKNRQALDLMPQFLGTNLISRVKPAATLLGQSKTSLSRVGVMPVFASETFGRGRTFAMASDSTSHWGRYFESQMGEGDNRYFRKFWRNVVRWLAENSQASERRLIVRSDKVIYSVDEMIQIRAEAFDEQLETTTGYRLTAEVTLPDADLQPEVKEKSSVEFDVQPDLKQYVAEIPAMLPKAMFDSSQPMQAIQVVVKAWDGDEVVATNAMDLQLIQDSKEWLNPQSKPALLRRVADIGGGKLISDQNQLSQLLSSFDSAPGEVLVHTLPLWDHPLLWTALLGMLAIDWTVRRIGFRNRKP